jgi:hypothetical protein
MTGTTSAGRQNCTFRGCGGFHHIAPVRRTRFPTQSTKQSDTEAAPSALPAAYVQSGETIMRDKNVTPATGKTRTKRPGHSEKTVNADKKLDGWLKTSSNRGKCTLNKKQDKAGDSAACRHRRRTGQSVPSACPVCRRRSARPSRHWHPRMSRPPEPGRPAREHDARGACRMAVRETED